MARVNPFAACFTTALSSNIESCWSARVAKSVLASAAIVLHIASICAPSMAMDAPDQVTAEASSDRIGHIDFINDLLPMFTKLGCNAGKCHGSAIGRGGFKLSLYGGTPQADYDEIVRRQGGRRINLVVPESSLIFKKPSELIEHGGGEVLTESNHASLLIGWIQQGAKFSASRKLESIEAHPTRFVAMQAGEKTKLKVIARYADGTTRDVTNMTQFKADDPSAVKIDIQTTAAEVLRPGRHIITARYSTEVVPIELITPHGKIAEHVSREPRINFVDDEILQTLSELGLVASPALDDQSFLRRITLDLTGRLPKYQPQLEMNAGEREQTIDRLLNSEQFIEFYTLKLAKLLRIQSKQDKNLVTTTPAAAKAFHDYLATQLRNGVGYDQIAREIITATGDTSKYGPAAFFTLAEDPRLQTELTTEVFMGSRMKCANCHNHPLDTWTQDDFHGLTAMFSKLSRSEVIRLNPIGKNIHPNTGEAALMKIPGGDFLPGDTEDGRTAFADWLTEKDNPYFAKAIVNRLWKSLMGRGLVEPLDDFRSTNPATHPALLEKLAQDFVDHDYDIRHTLRTIALSSTYSRSSVASGKNETDERFYSHHITTPLEPEVLADAISEVLGIPTKYGNEAIGTRAMALKDGGIPSDALDILGRCNRSNSCEGSPASLSPLAQKLHMFNGELLNGRIGSEGGRLDTLIKSGKTPMEIVTEFYQIALSRQPNPQEVEFFVNLFDASLSSQEQRNVLEDFVWGIVTCKEFVLSH